MSLLKEREVVREAVRQAGQAVIEIGVKTIGKQQVIDRTVLTEADLEADRILQKMLLQEHDDYGWLSEESKGPDRLNRKRVWIVDPIDGTREYVLSNPEFVVSVALVEDGQVILSAIYNPSTDDLYDAVLDEGACLNGQPITSNHVFKGTPVVEVSSSDIEKGRFSGYESHLDLRPCGSIAYKLARLAAGMSDSTLSITPKNEWDIAAGVLLVTEAGGKVTDLAGEPYVFNQPDTLVNGVIAASAEAYDKIKEIVDTVE
ncbi:MAG: 3'(2'),5'-bisphosphate nucleotidase CysQ [Planctomycetes bacterium]|nr:3'(2'),5'-bisphosphate nucleotidase CysQ [Planctomycetota bacterium]